jgi:glycosyltransferase involved in cell wall biosynthesis
MFDLVSLRKPVIISRTRAVEGYFGSECFQMFESEDVPGLADAIYAVYADPRLRERLVQSATARNESYRWVHQAKRYVEIIEGLAARRGEAVSDGLSEVAEKV